jgi:WhiB family redox-sensing transcriptional regulator
VNIPDFGYKQACLSVEDPDLFFPEPRDQRGAQKAKSICNGCEVIDACLKYAVHRPELEGIWGGTTKRQRDTLRSKLRKMGNVKL